VSPITWKPLVSEDILTAGLPTFVGYGCNKRVLATAVRSRTHRPAIKETLVAVSVLSGTEFEGASILWCARITGVSALVVAYASQAHGFRHASESLGNDTHGKLFFCAISGRHRGDRITVRAT